MNYWKSIRVLLILAASWVLMMLAVKSSEEAEAVETMSEVAASEKNSFVEGNLLVELSNQGGFPI